MPWQWSNRSKARKSRQEHQEQATERIAFELYQNRLLLGRPGDQDSDWEEARQIAHSPIRTTLFASNRPLIKLRKPTAKVGKFIALDIPRWFLVTLPKQELIKLIAVPLIIAGAGGLISSGIQREANQNAALKTYFDQLDQLTVTRDLLTNKPKSGAIPLARGRTVAALRELDYERRKQLIAFLQASELTKVKEEGQEPVISFRKQDLSKLDLHDINLSFAHLPEANLEGANLEGAALVIAYLEGANLKGANLKGADLEFAHLPEANLEGTNLKGVYLTDAILPGANLEGANLKGADLGSAILTNARLKGANLQWAVLASANLQWANLQWANLEGANLNDAKLEGANLEGADLTGAFLVEANLEGAMLCRTTLPVSIKLDPNRDCKELGIDPKTGKVMP